MSFTENEMREATELGDDFLVGDDPFEGHGSDDEEIVGVSFIRYPNGGYRRVSKKEAAKYNVLSPSAKKMYQRRYDPTCNQVAGRPPGYYRMVQTPGGVSLRMANHLADQWKGLTPSQQRSLLWRATRNAGTVRKRQLPCL